MMMERTEQPRAFGNTPEPTDDNQPTEDEQMNYDLLAVRARKMMYGNSKDKILQLLGTGKQPAQSLGQTAAMIVRSLMTSAKQSGREIGGDVAINAGMEIIEDLNDLAKAKGVFKYDSPEEEKQQLEDAVLYGVKYYGDAAIQAGDITPEMQAEAKQMMQDGIAQEQATKKTPVTKAVQGAMKPGIVGGM